MREFNRLAVLLGAGLLLGAAAATAQAWRGDAGLEVRVSSRKGGALTGARVEMTYREGRDASGPAAVTTDAKGRAVLGGLAAGTWQLEVSHPDFMSYVAVLRLSPKAKPEITASFLEATGESTTPIQVKLLKTSATSYPPLAAAAPKPPPAAPTPQPALPQPAAPAQEPVAPEVPKPTPPSPEPPSPRAPVPEASAPEATSAEPPSVEIPEAAPTPILGAPPAEAPQAETETPETEAPEPPITAPAAPEMPKEPPTAAPPDEVPAATPAPEPDVQEPATSPPTMPHPAMPAPGTDTPAPSAPAPALAEPPLPEPSVPESFSPEPALPEPSPSEPPPPAPAGATPHAPMATLPAVPPAQPPQWRAYEERTCPECRPGEWAVTVAASVGGDGGCGEATRDAVASALATLAARPSLELAGFAGGVEGAVALLEPEEAADVQHAFGGADAEGCRILGVVLPKGSRFVGFQYEIEDGSGRRPCLPDQPCPGDTAAFAGPPRISRGASSTVIHALARATDVESTGLAANALMTVFFRGPNNAWAPER